MCGQTAVRPGRPAGGLVWASSKPVELPKSKRKGAKFGRLLCCAAIGLFLRFALPVPSELTGQAWSMLAIFVTTIAMIVSAPLPAPAVALCMLVVGVVTRTFTFADGVSAFSEEVIWMIILAMFLAKGISKTGLGPRVAYSVVRVAGGTTLGLAYGLNLCELLVASCMPSSAARAAGIFYPIVVSVAKASGSDPELGTRSKMGSFLVQNAFQTTANSSALWMTGCSLNLLMIGLANQMEYDIPSTFNGWLKLTCVPVAVCWVLTPLLVYLVCPPQQKVTPDAPAEARRKLKEMGPMTQDEKLMAAVMMVMVVFWINATGLGISPVTTAMGGLGVLLLFGVLSWDDCASEKSAWGTFVWFSVLVAMGKLLNKIGLVEFLASSVSARIASAGLSSSSSFVFLLVLYLLSHYFFASQVAHVSAMFQPFAAMMVRTGTQPLVAVMSLVIVSNAFSTLTPYASAQAVVFYAGGYVKSREWYRLGILSNILCLAVWSTVGVAWWYFLGVI
eukprot:TRINITY_DN804_c0_g1_i1.p1 TRINITY_DN804_c0_g1~~TRINITY_DN804_c0_g1_i1.p1  ORF type:complete len:543 (+),score=70.22 TRINITY_DN804_c0_g1_i1:119-1630(+)